MVLLCGGVVYLTLFYQLGNLSFFGSDEPRYARVGEEMNLRGSYITPTLNFRPWLEKPPLLFWLEAVSFRLFGVHEWSARLPAATLALLSLFIVALLAEELAGRRVALFTGLILCTSGLFFVFARAASTDTLLVALLTTAMVCGFQATRNPTNLWAASAGLALGLAVLAKGPVAVVLFAGVFGTLLPAGTETRLEPQTNHPGNDPIFLHHGALVLAGLERKWIRLRGHLLDQSSSGTLRYRHPPPLGTLLVLPGRFGPRIFPLGLFSGFRPLSDLAATQTSSKHLLPS